MEGITMNSKTINCNGFIIRETEKAVLFLHDWPHKPPVWLPKSQITIIHYEFSDTLKIPRWLAERHSIRPKPTPIELPTPRALNGENEYGNGL
jgi:hypothetical protein